MKLLRHGILTLFTFFSFSGVASAQEVDIIKGELDFLKGEKTINIEFTYDKMMVADEGKEADYIKKKTAEMNAKEAGTGDTWAFKWQDDKTNKYEPRFITAFQNLSGITMSKDAKYTLIFNTKAMDPGYSIGISKRNAGIDGTVTIVESANRSKVLAKLSVDRPEENKFRGAAFDAGSRIADAYNLSGQKVGKFIKKNLKG